MNPSYWSPRAFAAIERVDLNEPARRLTDQLTANGLPPDWARIDSGGATPTGPPSGGDPSTPSTPCGCRSVSPIHARPRTGAGRAHVAHLRDDPGVARRALDGPSLTDGQHPEALDAEHPTYYGKAWVELTRAMLRPGALGTCG